MMRRFLTQSRGKGLPASKRAAALARCTAGVSAVEFALVSPIFLTMLTGLFDLGQMVYAKAVLSGAVQQAARDSSLETADTTRADRIVRGIVGPILPGTAIITTRVSYYDFADIGRKERWNDLNNNGTCDNNESYVDENRSTHWEADIGVSGNGGAGDVVLYTATAQYSPIFKIPFAPYNWNQRNLMATAVRKNQPFADQTRYGASSGTCA